jgi:hypothetical protein
MKNMGFYLVIVAVIGVFITGCQLDDRIKGNGNITNTERIAEGFKGILLEGVANINVHFSEDYKVVVTTDSNIQDYITIEVKNSLLYVDEKRTRDGINPTKIIIDVYLPELENITSKGVGNIEIDSGNGSALNLTLSGVGNIDAQNFQAQNVTVGHSGVGNVKIWATNTLNGYLSGVGNIFYKGNPTMNVNRTGVGNVKKL